MAGIHLILEAKFKDNPLREKAPSKTENFSPTTLTLICLVPVLPFILAAEYCKTLK